MKKFAIIVTMLTLCVPARADILLIETNDFLGDCIFDKPMRSTYI